MNLPLVPYQEWLDLLEKSGAGLDANSEVEALRNNPALRILDFFRAAKEEKSPKSQEVMGLPLLDVSQAQKDSPTLAALNAIAGDAVDGSLAFWKRVGFL